MPQNYTFSASTNVAATSTTGYSQSASGNFSLNITGVDQVATGRLDVAHDGDATIMAAAGYGRAIYVRNLDDTNFVTVYNGASSGVDPIAVLEPGEFCFTVIRSTTTTVARADTATVTVEYFALEIDTNA